jgi:hypothetical protein
MHMPTRCEDFRHTLAWPKALQARFVGGAHPGSTNGEPSSTLQKTTRRESSNNDASIRRGIVTIQLIVAAVVTQKKRQRVWRPNLVRDEVGAFREDRSERKLSSIDRR